MVMIASSDIFLHAKKSMRSVFNITEKPSINNVAIDIYTNFKKIEFEIKKMNGMIWVTKLSQLKATTELTYSNLDKPLIVCLQVCDLTANNK